jgi:hypothetical protein
VGLAFSLWNSFLFFILCCILLCVFSQIQTKTPDLLQSTFGNQTHNNNINHNPATINTKMTNPNNNPNHNGKPKKNGNDQASAFIPIRLASVPNPNVDPQLQSVVTQIMYNTQLQQLNNNFSFLTSTTRTSSTIGNAPFFSPVVDQRSFFDHASIAFPSHGATTPMAAQAFGRIHSPGMQLPSGHSLHTPTSGTSALLQNTPGSKTRKQLFTTTTTSTTAVQVVDDTAHDRFIWPNETKTIQIPNKYLDSNGIPYVGWAMGVSSRGFKI